MAGLGLPLSARRRLPSRLNVKQSDSLENFLSHMGTFYHHHALVALQRP